MSTHSTMLIPVGLSLVLVAGTITCDRTPTTPDPVCTFSIVPPSRAFSSDAGEGVVSVTASAPTCAWIAVSNAPWVSIIAPASGVGSGSVRYTVAANASTDVRAANIAIEAVQHTITQAGVIPPPCAYAISPNRGTAPSGGGTGRIAVSTAVGCTWTATSSSEWIVIVSGTTGTGAGAVDYRVDANRRETPRSGSITVGDQVFVLEQAGEQLPTVCDYAVAPVEFSPCMSAGSLITRITTSSSCSWTVQSAVPWLRVASSESGTGSGDIRAEYSSNYDAPRVGTLLVRWPTPTAGQNVRVLQAGCRYGVGRSAIPVPVGGGVEMFDVVQQSVPTECGGATQDRCLWSATADVAWIDITTSMPRVGDDRVTFTVLANSTGDTRIGTITVRDQRVVITQAGR